MSNGRIGTINVSMEFLAKVLHFPEAHTIVDVRRVDKTPFGQFEVLCSGATLPEVADGADIPKVSYTVTQAGSAIEGKFSTTVIGVVKVDEPESRSSQTYGHPDNYAMEFEPDVVIRAKNNADAPYDQRTCKNYPWAAAARIRVLEAELRIARGTAKVIEALDSVGLKVVEK